MSDGSTTHVGKIWKISISDTTQRSIFYEKNFVEYKGLAVSKSSLYVADYTSNYIREINLLTQNLVSSTNFSMPIGLCIDADNKYLYASSRDLSQVLQINLSDKSAAPAPLKNYTNNSMPSGMAIYKDTLYIANYDVFIGGYVQTYNITNDTISKTLVSFAPRCMSYSSVSKNLYCSSTISDSYNKNLLTANSRSYGVSSGTIFKLSLNTEITCFKEGSKILTNNGYKPVEDLRKGDLIKTLKNDYKKIDMIATKKIYHPALKERIKDQLYKCTQSKYPEIFEDLIITGCHSILVSNFVNPEQKEKTSEVNTRIFVTDGKYRLPACVDDRTCVYENPGTYTIYHFALENDDYYMNYGVFANGLLVETCSKRYLKEIANMIFLA